MHGKTSFRVLLVDKITRERARTDEQQRNSRPSNEPSTDVRARVCVTVCTGGPESRPPPGPTGSRPTATVPEPDTAPVGPCRLFIYLLFFFLFIFTTRARRWCRYAEHINQPFGNACVCVRESPVNYCNKLLHVLCVCVSVTRHTRPRDCLLTRRHVYTMHL